jgi:hypothetical protein
MAILKSLFLILVVLSLASAALVKTEVTMATGQGIDLSADSLITVMDSCKNGTCFVPPDSVLKKKKPFDLAFFALGWWEGSSAIGPCGGLMLSLFAKDTIWRLNNRRNLDLGQPLSTADTAHFTCMPPTGSSKLWGASCPDFYNPCPQFIGDTAWEKPVIWYLGKTQEGLHVLFKFVSQSVFRAGPDSSYHTAVGVVFILQTDGSLDFSGSGITAIRSPLKARYVLGPEQLAFTKRNSLSAAQPPRGALYDIRGRRIAVSPGTNIRSRFSPRVYIISNK